MNAKMYKFDYIKNSVKDYLQKIFLEKFICLSYCEEINYNKSSNEHMEKKGNVSSKIPPYWTIYIYIYIYI
ncbi:hypothetical protein PFDG_05099, partial [Plasmodium falciparum Dd2]